VLCCIAFAVLLANCSLNQACPKHSRLARVVSQHLHVLKRRTGSFGYACCTDMRLPMKT